MQEKLYVVIGVGLVVYGVMWQLVGRFVNSLIDEVKRNTEAQIKCNLEVMEMKTKLADMHKEHERNHGGKS